MPEASTMTSLATSEIETRSAVVKLSQLRPWAKNPRKARTDEQIDAMAGSISSVGLISPLLVCLASDHDGYDVIAGVTRYLALQRINPHCDPIVPVNVIAGGEIDDTTLMHMALAENTARNGMSVQDQVKALRELVSAGRASVDAAVAALGVERRQALRIFQYLALSKASEREWNKGSFGDDFAYVLSTLPEKRQAEVLKKLSSWEISGNGGEPSADRLERMISDTTMEAKHVRFDRDEFKKRGGQIIGDLLGNESFAPLDLAFKMQAEEGQRMADTMEVPAGPPPTFVNGKVEGLSRRFVHLRDNQDVGKKLLKGKIRTVVFMNYDGELITYDDMVAIDDIAEARKQKEKAAREKQAKEIVEQGGVPPEEDNDLDQIPTKLNDFGRLWTQSLAQRAMLVNTRLCMAIFVARTLRRYQQPPEPMRHMDDFVAGSPVLMEMRETIDKRIAEAKPGPKVTVAGLLKLKPGKLERLFTASMAECVQPYGYRSEEIMQILDAAKLKPEKEVFMATPEALKTLRKAQLLDIATAYNVALTPTMKRDEMVDRLHDVLGKKPWQFGPMNAVRVDTFEVYDEGADDENADDIPMDEAA